MWEFKTTGKHVRDSDTQCSYGSYAWHFFSSFDIKLGTESIETLKHMKQSKRLLSYPSLVEIVEGGLLFVHFCIRLCKMRQGTLRKAWKISAHWSDSLFSE